MEFTVTHTARPHRRLISGAAAVLTLATATAVMVVHGRASAQPTSTAGVATDAADVNGDGRDDLVSFKRSTGEVFVRLSNGRSFGTQTRWLSSTSFVDATAEKQSYQLTGDFNGDGRSDAVHFLRREVGDVYVALSTGSAFGVPVRVHGNFSYRLEVPAVGDFNGDGLDDLATFTRGGSGDVYILLSAGDGRSFSVGGVGRVWHNNFAYGSEVPFVGDVNGDGRDDILTYRHQDGSRVYAALSDGTSFYATGSNRAPVWLEMVTGTETGEPALTVADVNRDGRGDIVVVHNRVAQARVMISTGGRFAEPSYYLDNGFEFLNGDDTVGVGDFDGNGSTDVIDLGRTTGGVWVLATAFPRNAVMRDHCAQEATRWVCRAAIVSTNRWASGFGVYGPGEGPLARDETTAPDNRWLGDSSGVLVGN
jgi:hypothetical protein